MDGRGKDPRSKYEARYLSDKEKYAETQRIREEEINEQLIAGKGVADAEGFEYFDSPVIGDSKFNQRGLFDPGFSSFHNLGGFTAESLRKWIQDWKAEQVKNRTGKKFLAIDWFGQGSALVKLGADRVIATTRTAYVYEDKEVSEKVLQINGEGLSARVSAEALSAVRAARANGGELLLGIWRPLGAFAGGGGLFPHENNLYVFTTLYNRFRNFYREFAEGALLFIGSMSIHESDIQFLKTILKSAAFPHLNGLIVDERKTEILIKKPANSRLLPTEQEVLEKIPDILESVSHLELTRVLEK